MIDIRTFLNARLDEDEAIARAAHPGTRLQHPIPRKASSSVDLDMVAYTLRFDPARTLADIEAKQAIIDVHAPDAPDCHWSQDSMASHGNYACETLRALAGAWADQSDYDPSWRIIEP